MVSMSRVVKKKGHADWADLIGKEISFDWHDGYDDFPYWFHGVLDETRPHAEDPRYPRYYIIIDGGGPSVWEDEEVVVTVHD